MKLLSYLYQNVVTHLLFVFLFLIFVYLTILSDNLLDLIYRNFIFLVFLRFILIKKERF